MVQGATELTWEEVLKHCEENQVRGTSQTPNFQNHMYALYTKEL